MSKYYREYWVFFPRGIDYDKGNEWTNVMMCKTYQRAWDLMIKYNGAYVEKVCMRNGKRYVSQVLVRQGDECLTDDELYDKYKGPCVDMNDRKVAW